MAGTLEGLDVGISLSISGSFETPVSKVIKQATVGDGIELTYEVSARVLSGNPPVPIVGENGLLKGTVTVNISGDQVSATFVGQAQPAGFTIEITGLPPGYATGTTTVAGEQNGVNDVLDPTTDAGTLTLSWQFWGFQPGTNVTQTVAIDLPANNLPDIEAPATTSGQENAAAIDISGIKITDGDGDAQTVTLTVANGILSLGTTTGLSFVAGDGSGDAAMTFSGTLVQIDAALATLAFQPQANFTGSAVIQVSTSDGKGGTATQSIAVNVSDADPNLVGATIAVDENSANGTVVHTMVASGDTNGLFYSIVSGNDDGAFSIDRDTGKITVLDGSKLDYESTKTYTLGIGVDDEDGDANNDATAIVTINLQDINDAPVITSVSPVTVQENETAVLTVTASDDDGDSLTYSISGREDGAKFEIDPATGELKFVTAPDFEAPADNDRDNIYKVEVTVTDSHDLATTRLIAVTVTDKSDEVAPVVTVNALSTTDRSPALSGTIDDPLAMIKVTVAANTYSAVNNADGTWTLADNTIANLATGTYDVVVVATDNASNTGTDTSHSELSIFQSGGGVDPGVHIPGGSGPDVVTGGDGNDTLGGGGDDDRISGGAGNDQIYGGTGNDTVFGGDGDDHIFGGADNGKDRLYGGRGDDMIWAGGGNDRAYGGDGDDVVGGGDGNDEVGGGNGNDTLYGGTGSDSVYGGAGDDKIWGGAGNDMLSGGTGKDTFFFAPGHGQDTLLDFTRGDDRMDLRNFGDIDFADLSISVVGDGSVIAIGGISITVNNITTLSASDFIFA